MVELSDENNLDEVPVNVISKNEINNLSYDSSQSNNYNIIRKKLIIL